MDIISTILLSLCFIAILHCILESIIIPSLRVYLNLRLLGLRKKIILIKKTTHNDHDNKSIKMILKSIDEYVNKLDKLSISFKYKLLKEFNSDPEIDEKVKNKIRYIENSNNKDIAKIFINAAFTLKLVYLINMGGWFLFFGNITFIVMILIFKSLPFATFAFQLAIVASCIIVLVCKSHYSDQDYFLAPRSILSTLFPKTKSKSFAN